MLTYGLDVVRMPVAQLGLEPQASRQVALLANHIGTVAKDMGIVEGRNPTSTTSAAIWMAVQAKGQAPNTSKEDISKSSQVCQSTTAHARWLCCTRVAMCVRACARACAVPNGCCCYANTYARLLATLMWPGGGHNYTRHLPRHAPSQALLAGREDGCWQPAFGEGMGHVEESRADGKGYKVGKEERGDAAGHKARTRLCWWRRCSWWRRRCSACWVWRRCVACDQGRSGVRRSMFYLGGCFCLDQNLHKLRIDTGISVNHNSIKTTRLRTRLELCCRPSILYLVDAVP